MKKRKLKKYSKTSIESSMKLISMGSIESENSLEITSLEQSKLSLSKLKSLISTITSQNHVPCLRIGLRRRRKLFLRRI